jgi:hypothetical protein
VVVLQFDAKRRVGKQFDYESRKLQQFFFRHKTPYRVVAPIMARGSGGHNGP